MDLEDSASPHWSPFSDNRLSTPREPSAGASGSQNTAIHFPDINLNPPMPRRFPGDGLDHRRPITSTDVIDLTEEDAVPAPAHTQPTRNPTRPPRFGREIMDNVIDLATDEPQDTSGPPSPDLEIVGSRSIAPAARRLNPQPIELDEEGDDVVFVSETRRSIPPNIMQAVLELPRLRAVVEQRVHDRRYAERQRQATINRVLHIAARQRHSSNTPPQPPPRAARSHIFTRDEFTQPQMRYGEVGFDLGYSHNDPPSPDPTYKAPGKAPNGFTRSPQEEDSLICPNCEDELCIGDGEQKRQVWLVKACGHVGFLCKCDWMQMLIREQVYCGDCTANRYVSKSSAKGKERQTGARKHFKECVVEGCSKRVSSPKSMIQIFL